MPDNHYVNLKDGVVFAHHQTDGEIETSDTVVAVSGDDSPYINHVYDSTSNTFTPAPEIKYAVLDSNNTVVQIRSTFFQSEAGTNPIITDPSVQVLWTWDGSNFNAPGTAVQHPVLQIGEMSVTTSSALPGFTHEQLTAEQTAEQARRDQFAQQQVSTTVGKSFQELQLEIEASVDSLQSAVSAQGPSADQPVQGTQGV